MSANNLLRARTPGMAPRKGVTVFAAGALLAVLAACGGSPAAAPAAPAPSAAPAESSAFPVTIDHQFGSTTIDAAPTRVVTVGFNEADFALAFDVVPVGVRDFTGDFAEEQRPWAQQALAGAQPENIGDEIDFERVAALQPDLILGLYSFIEQADYDKLAAIAPTIGPLNADGNITWQDQTRITGQALGQPERADEIIAETEQKFADAKAANPNFAGKALSVLFSVEGTMFVLDPGDPREQFFLNLGFAEPAYSGDVGAEQLQVLDGDVLAVLGLSQADLASNRLFQDLSVVKDNRTIWFGGFDTDFAGALGFGSPLSLSYAIDQAVPRLAAAADGDPATSTD